MVLLHSKKALLLLLVLLILLPIGVIAVLNRTNIFPRATIQQPVVTVKINPGQIVTDPNGPEIHLSAQAVDANGGNVDGVRYQWGMSSTNSIGTVTQEYNDKLATFIPSANIGQGDLWVRAFDTNGQSVTGSIPVYIGVPPYPAPCSQLPPECQNENWQACVANMGVPEGGWCPPPIPTPTSCSGQPDGTTCTTSCPVCEPNQPCPLIYCRPQQGICRRNYCVPITPSPAPSPGCYYVYPQCAQPIEGVQAPCEPIIVCQSPPACPSPPPCPGPIVVGDPGFGGCPRYYCQTTPTPTPTIWNCDALRRTQSNYYNQCSQSGFPRICFDKYTAEHQGCVTADRDDCTTYNTNANRNILCTIGLISSTTPTATRTPSPTPAFCQRNTPAITIVPNSQSGSPGQQLSYRIELRNNDSANCPGSQFSLSVRVPPQWTYALNSTSPWISPGVTQYIGLSTLPPTTYSPGNTPITVLVDGLGVQNHSTQTTFNHEINQPPKITGVEFKIKFSGVTDGAAEGAGVTARFVRSDLNALTSPIRFHHIGGGVYQAVATLSGTLSLPAGPGYTIIMKGEKHVARKFCKQTGQTAPCQGNESMTISSGPSSPVFDFTGLTLDPGDLPPQDYKADSADFDIIKTLLSKPCSILTDQDKKTADLDYNGCIDIGDAFLMRKTLETRYDEN